VGCWRPGPAALKNVVAMKGARGFSIVHGGHGLYKHNATLWAVNRRLVEGAVKPPSGWLIPTSRLPSLKAAVLMYKAVVEARGRVRL